jgi:hypothetical protein
MICNCGILSLVTTYFKGFLKFRCTRCVHSADAACYVDRIDGITLDPANESFRTKVTYVHCIWNIYRLWQRSILNNRKGRRDIRNSVGSYCACIMRLNGLYFFFTDSMYRVPSNFPVLWRYQCDNMFPVFYWTGHVIARMWKSVADMARNVLETNRQNLSIPPRAKSTEKLTNKRDNHAVDHERVEL